jgi:hypothetical protein
VPPDRKPDENSDHDDMRVRMIHNRSHGPHRFRARDSWPPASAPASTRREQLSKVLRGLGRPSRGRPPE